MTDETEGKPVPAGAPVFVDPKGDDLILVDECHQVMDFDSNSEITDEEQERAKEALEEVEIDPDEIVAELEADLEGLEDDTDD